MVVRGGGGEGEGSRDALFVAPGKPPRRHCWQPCWKLFAMSRRPSRPRTDDASSPLALKRPLSRRCPELMSRCVQDMPSGVLRCPQGVHGHLEHTLRRTPPFPHPPPFPGHSRWCLNHDISRCPSVPKASPELCLECFWGCLRPENSRVHRRICAGVDRCGSYHLQNGGRVHAIYT